MADIALVVLFVAAFVLGYVRGAVRQLLAFGAWLVTFVLSAHLRVPVGDWLRSMDARFSENYGEMLGFLLMFLVLFGVAMVVIEVAGATIQVSRIEIVDDMLGGVLMVGVALVFVASLLFALETYYAVEQPIATTEVGFVADAHAALQESRVAGVLRSDLVPGLDALLGPLMPPDVSDLF